VLAGVVGSAAGLAVAFMGQTERGGQCARLVHRGDLRLLLLGYAGQLRERPATA
jgi:hypothetical protein